jgi:hypothetical protein
MATSTAARTAAAETSGSTDLAAASDLDETEMLITIVSFPDG